MRKFFLSMASALIAVSAMADSYTLTFMTGGTSDSSTSYTDTTAVTDVLSAGADYVTSFSNVAKVYKGREGRGIKFGSTSVAGSITLNLSDAGKVKATSIVINGGAYISGGAGENSVLTVNGQEVAFDKTVTTFTLADYTVSFDVPTEITSLELVQQNASKGRFYINNIVVNYTNAETPAFADGDYLIKNKAAQQYLGGGNYWGTCASVGLPQWFTLTLTDGAYTLDSHQSNGGDNHFLGTGLYVDAGAAGWNLVKGDNGVTIENGGNYLAQDGAYAPIKTVTDGTDANAQWEVISKAQFIASLQSATKNAPVDATALIYDPEFKRNGNTSKYWTITGFDGTGNPGNFAQGQGGNVASCGESWHSSNGFKAVQTISLPYAGIYELTAQAFYRQDNGEEALPYLFAGDKTSEFPLLTGDENNMVSAYAAFKENKYPVAPIKISVAAAQDIEIGVAGSATASWNIFGQLQLTYLGEDIEAQAVATIEAYNAVINKPMNEGVQTLAIAAYNEYQANPTKQTLAALSTAVSNCQKSANEYAAFQTTLNDVNAKVAALTESGKQAFQTLAADLIASFTGCQMEGNKSAELKAYYVQAVLAQTEVGAEYVDAAPTAWTGSTGNLAPNWANATPYTYAERYNGGAIEAGDVMTQTFEGLAAGNYKVTLAAAASYTSGRGFECQTGDSLSVVFANDAQGNLPVVDRTTLPADAEVLYEIAATVGEDGKLTYGIKNLVAAGNWYAVAVLSIKSAAAAPTMTITFDKETSVLTFTPSDLEAYYYPAIFNQEMAEENEINPDTFVADLLAGQTYESLISGDGDYTLCQGVIEVPMGDYFAYMGYGQWYALSNFVAPGMTISETTWIDFYATAPASTMTVASTEITSTGGKIKFSADVILANYVEIATCDVKKGDEVVAQATLSLNDNEWDAVDVSFTPALEVGATYSMDLTGLVLEYETLLPFAGVVDFTVEAEPEVVCTLAATPMANYETFCGTATFVEYDSKIVIKSYDGTEGNDLVIKWDETGYSTINGEASPWVYIDNTELPYYGAYLYTTGGYTGGNWTAEGGEFWIGGYFYKLDGSSDWGYMYWSLAPEKAPEVASCDLTAEMFHRWTAAVDGEITETAPWCEYKLNEATGLPYGNGNVDEFEYADVAAWAQLAITYTEGTPRPLFNRDVAGGQAPDHLIDIPNNADQTAKYVTTTSDEDGNDVMLVDLAKIKADYGYVHLHCVKGAYWQNVTVTKLQLKSAADAITGIQAVSVESNETIVDLQGRKVSEMKAGQIYLIGGKKMLNK